MSRIPYTKSVTDEQTYLTVFIEGAGVKTAGNDHPNWAQIEAIVDSPDNLDRAAELARLLDPSQQVAEFFEPLSERVAMRGGNLFVDGDLVDGALADQILRYMDEGNDPQAELNFLEKVLTNPNEHSRTQLYDWLSRFSFAINENGNFLAYKGVYVWPVGTADDPDEVAKYPYRSISSGTAVVDGKPYTGKIPNGVGAVVEMPRSSVQHDPSVGCHTGLHAGTYEYARDFSQGAVLLVEINPRDVVSVPTDCNWQKIRTCRYTVVKVIESELNGSFYDDLDQDIAEDEYDDAWYDSASY